MSKKKYSRAYIEITNICNRNCSFCPGTKRPQRRMTEDEFSHILDQVKPLTDYIYLHIMGEPLTHPSLKNFIRMANEKGMKCAITTNGTLLPKVGDDIIDGGAYKVNISVHSFEAGEDSAYDGYINGCLDFADTASRRGVLTVLRLWNKGHDGGRNELTLDRLKARFPDGEWAMGARGARIRDKLHLEYGERFEWPDSSAEDFGNDVFCYGLRDHFGVLCDGTVVPCCLDHEGDIRLGNAFSESVADILESERARKILDGFSKRCAGEDLCRRCGYARRFK